MARNTIVGIHFLQVQYCITIPICIYILTGERKKTHCTKHLHDHVRNTTECKSILLLSYTGTVEKRERDYLAAKNAWRSSKKKSRGPRLFSGCVPRLLDSLSHSLSTLYNGVKTPPQQMVLVKSYTANWLKRYSKNMTPFCTIFGVIS